MLATLALISALSAAPATGKCAGLDALTSWLDKVESDRQRGAVLADDPTRLVAAPLRDPGGLGLPAMSIRVGADGLRAGRAGPVSPAGARQLVHDDPNVSYARENPKAFMRGVLILAEKDAPAASVKQAVAAATAEGERAWLVYRPSDVKTAPPSASALTRELQSLDRGESGVRRLVEIIQREWSACPGLLDALRTMSGGADRLETIVQKTVPALKECQCQCGADKVASIWWHFLRDLTAAYPVPPDRMDALPWGKPGAKWSVVGSQVAAALAAK
jgi:hypothetical protein